MSLLRNLKRPLIKVASEVLISARRPPRELFLGYHYLRHNQRRQEHLATLGLPLHGRTVLEVGAGIGDHTSFFLDRDCTVTSTEPRPENLEILRTRHAGIAIRELDLDAPDLSFDQQFQVVYCYGTLYHLSRPEVAIAFMAKCASNLLLLETCVSYGESEDVNLVFEAADNPTQARSGQGCRPTRTWVLRQLRRHFPFVYSPLTQPNHPEFPLDWSTPPSDGRLTRAIFIASRQPMVNGVLVEKLPRLQRRAN